MSWRTACLGFALLSAVLAWRGCTRAPARPPAAACAERDEDRADDRAHDADRDDAPARRGARPVRPPDSGATAGGADDDDPLDDGAGPALGVPAWALWLAPQPGEGLLHYRDRIVPVAQAAIAPHRARVARGRDAFAAAAHLDAHQQAELDAAVAEAADAIQTRVLDAVLGGELAPAHLKPTRAVAVARDVLDAVTRADRRFTAALREDQRALYARGAFDLADYLVFSTRWEDALGYAPP